jgi:hypothetical protein
VQAQSASLIGDVWIRAVARQDSSLPEHGSSQYCRLSNRRSGAYGHRDEGILALPLFDDFALLICL